MSIVLSQEEIAALTGPGRPPEQLAELRRQGFVRASMGRLGIVLPRAHFEAVKAGTYGPRTPEPTPDYSRFMGVERLHWRQRPEHQERLRLEREADLAERARQAEIDRLCAERVAAIKVEMERTRPERRATLVRFHASKRRVAELKRRPPWADMQAIRAIYADAVRLTRETGVQHHVDHVIPLQGQLVSGLHVENNLQVLPWRENILKRNHFEVEP